MGLTLSCVNIGRQFALDYNVGADVFDILLKMGCFTPRCLIKKKLFTLNSRKLKINQVVC